MFQSKSEVVKVLRVLNKAVMKPQTSLERNQKGKKKGYRHLKVQKFDKD